MKNIAVLPNRQKARAASAAAEAVRFLRRCGLRILAEEENRDIVDADEYRSLETGLFAACDAAVVFGGDGTLLRYATEAAKAELPVIGVNSGTLGYLTELEQNEIPQLAALCDDGLRIEERMMLESSLDGRIVDYALNEALISRGAAVRMLEFRLDCDGTAAATYRADGLILSTPTGSTAYAMSAGGPIVDPRLDAFTACPVCPHAFAAARALVFSPESVLTATVTAAEAGDIQLSCDGRAVAALQSGDCLTVRRAALRTRLIRSKRDAFYQTLYRKFNAGRSI